MGSNETEPAPAEAPTPVAVEPPDGELKDDQLTAVSGGLIATVLTNIANMKHESLKAIAQNLRA